MTGRPTASAGTTRWRYQAVDAQGAMTRGEVDAATVEAAVDLLRRRALWVIELEPTGATAALTATGATATGATATGATAAGGASSTASAVGTPASLLDRLVRRTTDGNESLAMLTRSVATLLEAGVPLERALAFAASGETDPRWQRIFGGLREAVTRGESLSEAAARVEELPRAYAPLLAAAEASGSMADTVARLADDLEQEGRLRSRVRAALVYPTLLAIASTVGTLVILVVVVPRFADLIAGAGGTVPASTRMLIGLSALLSRFGWLLVAAFVVAGTAGRQSLQDAARRRRWHAARLHWPLVGRFEREHAAANYLGTLAMALESGVPLLRAMSLARGTVGNDDLAERLSRAEVIVRDGGSVAQALAGSLTPLATRLLEAGEQGGALAPLARRAATTASDQVQRVITSAVALIEPVMILGFGGVVGFVALALLQAIYGINASSF
ncbi:type II secretion system F family protein [Gemmatimonas sp.]|uniref:type II secretion system F family protein n=1 Tax=Gemmatimonas sp. TaxID=1962908 RepID=UPI0039834411